MKKNTPDIPIFLVLILVLLTSCGLKQESQPTYSVSILPQKQWMDSLVGGTFKINCMLPSGSNPETYSPSPGQMQALSHSKGYFYVGGLGFEKVWMTKFKELNPNMILINSTSGIPRLEDHHHSEDLHAESDPHLWVSPKRAMHMIENMFNALYADTTLDQNRLRQNYEGLEGRLDKLDSLYSEAGRKSQNKTIVIYHPALSYLAHDYGFNQLSIEQEGKEPTIQHLKQLIDSIRTNRIKYIFIQKEFDKKSARLIADESGAQLIEIDPLGYDYLGESEKLARFLMAQ